MRAAARGLVAVLGGALVIGALTTLPSEAQELSVYGSLRYLKGGLLSSDQSDGLVLLNGIALRVDAIRLFIDVPLIHQSELWIVRSGPVYAPSRGNGHGRKPPDDEPVYDTTITTEWQTGFGDPLAGISVDLPFDLPWLISSGVSVKPPVADVERGFSTGEWDVGVWASFGYLIGATAIFADISYWHLGDPPEYRMLDPIGVGVAVSFLIDDGPVSITAAGGFSSGTVEDEPPPVDLSLSVSYRLASRASLRASGSLGLTKSAPGASVGIGWSIGL